jgi:hypothetical protein
MLPLQHEETNVLIKRLAGFSVQEKKGRKPSKKVSVCWCATNSAPVGKMSVADSAQLLIALGKIESAVSMLPVWLRLQDLLKEKGSRFPPTGVFQIHGLMP